MENRVYDTAPHVRRLRMRIGVLLRFLSLSLFPLPPPGGQTAGPPVRGAWLSIRGFLYAVSGSAPWGDRLPRPGMLVGARTLARCGGAPGAPGYSGTGLVGRVFPPEKPGGRIPGGSRPEPAGSGRRRGLRAGKGQPNGGTERATAGYRGARRGLGTAGGHELRWGWRGALGSMNSGRNQP
jgi:hypothetical protein